MLVEDFAIDSKNVRREGDVLVSTYDYNTTEVDRSADGEWTVRPVSTEYEFRTDTRVPKLGCVIPAHSPLNDEHWSSRSCLRHKLLKVTIARTCRVGPQIYIDRPGHFSELFGTFRH